MKVYSDDLGKKVLSAYQNGHIRSKPHGGGNRPAISEDGCGIVSEITDKKPDMTLKELCEYYEYECGKKVGKSATDRTLRKMKITRKKSLYDPEKDTERVLWLTEEYYEKLSDERPENFIFTDGTGVILNMTPAYGRSAEGKRVTGICSVFHGKRIPACYRKVRKPV